MNYLFPPLSDFRYETPSGLKPLWRPIDQDRPVRWLGDDGANCFIEVQGQLVAVAFREGPSPYPRELRGEVNGFSRSSRLRLFKHINRLQFDRCGRSTFITTTWRDELGRPLPDRLTQARSAWQKSLERLAKGQVPGIWRIEWQKRKSGRYAGQPMPHVHTVYFRAPYLPKEAISEAWARAIGWEGRVSCKINEITSLRQCLAYVSKYLAKIGEVSNLDIISYLAGFAPGRAWGIYRKNLLPVADRTEIRVVPGALVDKIRDAARRHYTGVPYETEKGFCVFGSVSQQIQEIIDQWCLQSGEETV